MVCCDDIKQQYSQYNEIQHAVKTNPDHNVLAKEEHLYRCHQHISGTRSQCGNELALILSGASLAAQLAIFQLCGTCNHFMQTLDYPPLWHYRVCEACFENY